MPDGSPSTTLQYAVIGAFVAIVIYAVVHYSRTLNANGFTRGGGDADHLPDAGENGAVAGQLGGGLAPDDVAVLPIFTYHAASPSRCGGGGKVRAADHCCAVCLDELGEGALVRMLPSCKHYFHAGCVDVWLLLHATCPVCRASPSPEKVRLGVASMSPPLPQLRRCGAASPVARRAETSRAQEAAAASRSPSPARSTVQLELITVVADTEGSVMSPSPSPQRSPESVTRPSRSPSPVTTAPSVEHRRAYLNFTP